VTPVRDDGPEIEVRPTGPAWAETDPVDAGTAAVAREGFTIVFDPDGIPARLSAAVRASTGDDH
jgi:hypothetical protein